MERRSEIVEGLETLREAILGYDAAADPKGKGWDELRVELDKGVLKLMDQYLAASAGDAARQVRESQARHYGPQHALASGAYHQPMTVIGVDLGVPGSEATAVQAVRVENNTLAVEPSLRVGFLEWPEFRRGLPAMWGVIQAHTDDLDADLKFNVIDGGDVLVWGETDRGRDFIAAKIRVRGRIGKHYRVPRSIVFVKNYSGLAASDYAVVPTPYMVGEGPAEVQPSACLLTPLTEAASIWIQNQAADGIMVLHKGKPLAEVEATPAR